MPALAPIPPSPALGPVYDPRDKNRSHYLHEQNETCSLTDRVFKDTSSLVLATEEPDYFYDIPCATPINPTSEFVIEDYGEMIKEHVERRLLFFFQQLIVCYQTKLHFEATGAKDQAQSAEAIVLDVNGVEVNYSARQAAHSSTLPRLIAYDDNAWQQFVNGGGARPIGFVFLKGTDYYRNANATINMPKWVNDADREIDEKTAHSLLRQKGLALVNQAAQGAFTPDQGIQAFIHDALFEIRAARTRLFQQNKDIPVQQVLSYYEEHFLDFQQKMQTDPGFLQKFLDISIDPASGPAAHWLILQMRYAAIRNVQVSQSALIQKVKNLSAEILTMRGNPRRKPDYLDAALRSLLIEQARTQENRHRLKKLFNFSPDDFENRLSVSSKGKFQKTKAVLSQGQLLTRIHSVAMDLLNDMRSLRTQEQIDRAQTIKELRRFKQWPQWQLAAFVKSRFPNAAASQSTISRIERGVKLVTTEIAGEFSEVFGVDPGLFMPHFFYE